MNEEFEVPPIPGPFQMTKYDEAETRKRKALFLRQSLRIVERFAHNPITLTMLSTAIPWLEREQYDDIAIERNAYGNCGYVLCANPKSEFSKTQKYKICTRTQCVYDTTKRRPFCSDWCFRASQFIRKQISKEPSWCRTLKQIKEQHLNILSPNVDGYPGKLILNGPKRLLLTESDSDSDNREEEKYSSKIINEQVIETDLAAQLNKVHFNTSHKEEPCVIEKPPEIGNNSQDSGPLSEKLNSEKPETTKMAVTMTTTATTTTTITNTNSDNNNILENNTDIVNFSVNRLQQWLTKEAITVLTNCSFNNLKDRFCQMSVKQFYSKQSYFKKRSNSSDSNVLLTNVLPLIDSVSPEKLRRQILLDDLKRSMEPLLTHVQVDNNLIYRKLENSVYHFNLTNKNLHMRPNESQFMSLILLRLMALSEPCLFPLLDDNYMMQLLKSINGPPFLLFVNAIINPALKMFTLDSDDDDNNNNNNNNNRQSS